MSDNSNNNFSNNQPSIGLVALALYDAGLSIIRAAMDGSKKPLGAWKAYQIARAHRDEVWGWFVSGEQTGIGVVCGAVSEHLECLDFDDRVTFDRFRDRAVACGLDALLDRITSGYQEWTPNGVHLLYFVAWNGQPVGSGNTKLAQRPRDEPGAPIQAIIETRGEGGFVVTAPSYGTVHPSGEPYTLIFGGPATIATITESERTELFNLARTFHELPPLADKYTSSADSIHTETTGDRRPGELFAAKYSWGEILTSAGWACVGSAGNQAFWRRPGKEHGISATTNYAGSDLFYCFSTSVAGIEAERGYDKFGFHVRVHFGGDFSAAAKAFAAEDMGQMHETVEKSRMRLKIVAKEPSAEQPADADEPARKTIQVNNKELKEVGAYAHDVLWEWNRPPRVKIFARDMDFVHIRTKPSGGIAIERVSNDALRGYLSESATYVKITKPPKSDYVTTKVFPPKDIVEYVQATPKDAFPPLTGILTTPSIRPDGSLLSTPGYDWATGFYYQPPAGFVLPPIAENPTREEVFAARNFLELELFCDFPFASPADRTNMFGLLLTQPLRPAIAGGVPLAMLDKSTPGAGASLLSDIVAQVNLGTSGTKAILPEGRSENADAELSKLITSLLLKGSQIVTFDNVEKAITSPVLAMALTALVWENRILGKNDAPELPVRCTWMVTSNNVRLGGDLPRRAYRIRLDVTEERPWERENFRHPQILTWIGQNRAQILGAILTLARGWFGASCPVSGRETPQMGSFEDWVRVIGGVLAYAGMDDFLGNLESSREDVDEEDGQWANFLRIWHETFGEEKMTLKQIIDHKPFPTAIFESGSTVNEVIASIPDAVGYDPHYENGSRKRLGIALGKHASRIYSGLKLVKTLNAHLNRKNWHVEPIGAKSQDDVPF